MHANPSGSCPLSNCLHKPVALLVALASLSLVLPAIAAEDPKAGRDPADELPARVRRLTWFGERTDWSHVGKRILFIEKTYGDAYEVEVATGRVRPVTHHYHHAGYTRALYLANGDISDDGRFLAFQMAKSKDPAGVGYGIFVHDLQPAPKR